MTQIVILAAGKGTRMNSDLPKVLVPLVGQPMIKYLMDSVVSSGVDSRPIIVVSPDNKEIISKALKNYEVEYVIQKQQLGTGHAVACAQSAFEDGQRPDSVIVLYGDHPFLKTESIKKFANLDQTSLTIMPTKLSSYDGWLQNFYHWGRIIRGLNGRVERIVELKDANDEERKVTEVNSGFMCFNYEWLLKNIKQLENNNSQQEYYLTDMVKIAFADNQLISTMDIGPYEALGVNSLAELEVAARLIKGNTNR